MFTRGQEAIPTEWSHSTFETVVLRGNYPKITLELSWKPRVVGPEGPRMLELAVAMHNSGPTALECSGKRL